jgi:hypothetical protein
VVWRSKPTRNRTAVQARRYDIAQNYATVPSVPSADWHAGIRRRSVGSGGGKGFWKPCQNCFDTVQTTGYRWTLVTRTPSGHELWRDHTSGFLWSDRAPETLPLGQARAFCATPAGGSDVMGRLSVDFALPDIFPRLVLVVYAV